MHSATVESYVSIGYDGMAIRYYTLAVQLLYYYDYLLTLPDEIRYAWAGRKTWIFCVFIFNRYTPILYQTWLFYVGFLPEFTHRSRCNKTSFISLLSFFWATLLAQTILIARLYALTFRRKRVVAFFSAITLTQLVLGMYMIGVVARKPALEMPPIPLPAYRLCVYSRTPPLEMAYMFLSLFFDVMAFSVVVFISFRSPLSFGTTLSLLDGRPSMLRTILEDATVYFFVIFGSHLVTLVVAYTTRPSIQLLPSLGVHALMPIMISRLMLSLKKASTVRESGWTSDALSRTHPRVTTPIAFGGRRNCPEDGGRTTFDEVELSDLSDGWVRGRSSSVRAIGPTSDRSQ